LRRGAPFSERAFAVGIAAMLVVGVVARVLVWVSVAGIADSDEAVGGLMAKHALSKERIIAADGRPNAFRVSSVGGVIPKAADPSLLPRHPQYDGIASRARYPTWVVDKAFDGGNLDLWAFSQAAYRSEDVGPFTIYYRPEGTSTSSNP
jgi:hypothetical protein